MSDMPRYKSWPTLRYEDTVFSTFVKCGDNAFYTFFRPGTQPPNSVVLAERSWMHEDIQNRDNLLISVGDSWTWGDSLFNIDAEFLDTFDHPDRVKAIYGAKLATMLNADFVNVGICGGANKFILSKLEDILKYNCTKYKKIYVVITLTENCRELRRFNRFANLWVDVTDETHKNLYDFIKLYEKNLFIKIKDLLEPYKENTRFLVGRNFTYSFEENTHIIKNLHLDKSWIDCLNEHQENTSVYPRDLRCLSQMAIKPIESYFKNIGFFDYIIEDLTLEINKSLAATDWLLASIHNHKKATKHPTVEGHKIWANYLYEQFMNGVQL